MISTKLSVPSHCAPLIVREHWSYSSILHHLMVGAAGVEPASAAYKAAALTVELRAGLPN